MRDFEFLLNQNMTLALQEYKNYAAVKKMLDRNIDFLSILSKVDATDNKLPRIVNSIIKRLVCEVFEKSCKDWVLNKMFDANISKELTDAVIEASVTIKTTHEEETGFNIFLAIETIPAIVSYINPTMNFISNEYEVNTLEIMLTRMKATALNLK